MLLNSKRIRTQAKRGVSMTEKEKAFDEKVKRFNMWTFAVFLSVSSSIITTLVLLAKLGVLR